MDGAKILPLLTDSFSDGETMGLMQDIDRYEGTAGTSSISKSWLLPLSFPLPSNGRLLTFPTHSSAAFPFLRRGSNSNARQLIGGFSTLW